MSASRTAASSQTGQRPRPSARFERLPPQHCPSLGLVQSAPHAVALPGLQRVVEAGLAHLAGRADPLGDRLTRELLPPLLEIARREVERGVLAAACGASLPAGRRLLECHHLVVRRTRGRRFLFPEGSVRRHTFSRSGRTPYAPASSIGRASSGATRRMRPSTPRT